MPPISTKYLEDKITALESKVADLEKKFDESISAIRSLSTENNNLISMLSTQQETLNEARADLKKVEVQLQSVAQIPGQYDNKVTRYE
jgi:regulator of replication initiation timing